MRSTASICQSNILAVIRNVSKNSHAQRLETSPRFNIASASWAPAHASTNTHEQRIDRLAWGVKIEAQIWLQGIMLPGQVVAIIVDKMTKSSQ